MSITNLHAAKTQLSRLVDRAVAGDDVVIAKAGRPVVRLVPIAETSGRTGFGSLSGKIAMKPGFDAPLPAALRRAFGTAK